MKRVLVCDDDKSMLYIMTFALTGIDWVVNTSEDCKNIIEKVIEYQPSVIIMDNCIPEIGGIKTIQTLKSHPLYKDIPVILCTSDLSITNLAEDAGADFYLSKPFEIKKIEKLMSEAYDWFMVKNSMENSEDQAEIA